MVSLDFHDFLIFWFFLTLSSCPVLMAGSEILAHENQVPLEMTDCTHWYPTKYISVSDVMVYAIFPAVDFFPQISRLQPFCRLFVFLTNSPISKSSKWLSSCLYKTGVAVGSVVELPASVPAVARIDFGPTMFVIIFLFCYWKIKTCGQIHSVPL